MPQLRQLRRAAQCEADEPWDDDACASEPDAHDVRKAKACSPQPVTLAAPPVSLQRCSGDVPSLESICLGVLAEHLDAVLAAGPELLSSFPWQWKAALLAVARRSGILNDEALVLLSDEDLQILDLAGARQLSSSTISNVLRGMPRLRALDLSFCAYKPALLASLHECVPRLELLRLAGIPARAVKAAVQALLQSLPRLSQPEDAAETWEDAAEERHEGFQGLLNLRHIVWLAAPEDAYLQLHASAPQLCIFTTVRPSHWPREWSASCPAGADTNVPLDEPHTRLVTQFDWAAAERQGLQSAAGDQGASLQGAEGPRGGRQRSSNNNSSAEVSLADRFRMAYASRAARVALVRERNARREARRALRTLGGAERALVLAERGVPLVPVKAPSRPR